MTRRDTISRVARVIRSSASVSWPPASGAGESWIELGYGAFLPDWHGNLLQTGLQGYHTQTQAGFDLGLTAIGYATSHWFFSTTHSQNMEWDRLVE